jgi:hypothetical protein
MVSVRTLRATGVVAPSNNALQLTSGGSMRASRASSMRRLQLNAVFGGLV